jgi:hypothetical protein
MSVFHRLFPPFSGGAFERRQLREDDADSVAKLPERQLTWGTTAEIKRLAKTASFFIMRFSFFLPN